MALFLNFKDFYINLNYIWLDILVTMFTLLIALNLFLLELNVQQRYTSFKTVFLISLDLIIRRPYLFSHFTFNTVKLLFLTFFKSPIVLNHCFMEALGHRN